MDNRTLSGLHQKRTGKGHTLPVGKIHWERAKPPHSLPRHIRKAKMMTKIAGTSLHPLSSFVFVSASSSIGRWGVGDSENEDGCLFLDVV